MIVNVYEKFAITEGCDCCATEIPLENKENLKTHLIDNILRTLIFCDELGFDYDQIFEEAAVKYTLHKFNKSRKD